MIKETILIAAVALYTFVLLILLADVRHENFTKSFLKLIDANHDGIITSKQMKDFHACPDYDGKRLLKQFHKKYERRADLNEFASLLHPKTVLKLVEKCVGDVDQAVNPEHLKKLSPIKLEKELLRAYDLNHDKEIKWAEFNIFNQFLKTKPSNLRNIFRFFDRNRNWKIEQKELQRSKGKLIMNYLATGKRK